MRYPSVDFGYQRTLTWSLKIEWDNWQRADGTSQTWHRMPPAHLRDWCKAQRRERAKIAKESLDVELEPLARTDIHNHETRLRAQAYGEKLAARRKFSPELEEQMEKLLAQKLGSGWREEEAQFLSGSATPLTPAHAGRGLRLSTVRRQQQHTLTQPQQRSGSSRKDTPKPPSVSGPVPSTSTSGSKPQPSLPTRQPERSLSFGHSPSPGDSERVRKRKLSEVGGEPGLSRYP